MDETLPKRRQRAWEDLGEDVGALGGVVSCRREGKLRGDLTWERGGQLLEGVGACGWCGQASLGDPRCLPRREHEARELGCRGERTYLVPLGRAAQEPGMEGDQLEASPQQTGS